jgi:DNA-binding IscR family transcriptional regulator
MFPVVSISTKPSQAFIAALTAALALATGGVNGFVHGADDFADGDTLTHALWRDLSERLTGFLNNITLGELVNNQEILDIYRRPDSRPCPGNGWRQRIRPRR